MARTKSNGTSAQSTATIGFEGDVGPFAIRKSPHLGPPTAPPAHTNLNQFAA